MNWQQYVKQNLKINQKRGYVFDDDIDNFYKNGVRLLNNIWSECCDLTGKSILDIGCGTGRLPIAIDGEAINIKSYTGYDIVPESIQFCKKAFAGNGKFQFQHLAIQNNRYAPNQKGNLDSVDFGNKQYDVLIANSVFTHIGSLENAKVYLSKLIPLVNEKGLLYITWFKNPPHQLSNDTKRTVFQDKDIINLYSDFDLKIVRSFGGIAMTSIDDQWRLIAMKA